MYVASVNQDYGDGGKHDNQQASVRLPDGYNMA